MKLSQYWLRFRIAAETLFVSCCYIFITLFTSVKLIHLIFDFRNFIHILEDQRFLIIFLPLLLSLTFLIHITMSIVSILSISVIYYKDQKLIRSYNAANRITSGFNLICILVLFCLVFFSFSKHLEKNNYQFIIGKRVFYNLQLCKIDSPLTGKLDSLKFNISENINPHQNKTAKEECLCCKEIIEKLRISILRLLFLYIILQVLVMDSIYNIEILAQLTKKDSKLQDEIMYDRYSLDTIE